MSKITNDEEFIWDLAKRTGWGVRLANWYWFGGIDNSVAAESFSIATEDLQKYLDNQIGYNDDADNPDDYFQHMYDNNKLSWEAIDYITRGKHIPLDKVFMCIWGDGYIEYGAPAIIECHGLPFFTRDNGFSNNQIQDMSRILVGYSLRILGVTEIMIVVRVA